MLILLLVSLLSSDAEPADATRTFEELCTAHGYLAENHEVTTEDGYILKLFRIPGLSSESPVKTSKPVVFMQHGLLDLSDTWITNQPSAGFLFADAGFDVWFGNSRGNKYSLKHTSKDPWTRKEFWEFSWQEMSIYDLPATIDYALNVTGKDKLTYVGHSQGTIIMFAHLTENPDFINKINIFIALAPIGSIKNIDLELARKLDFVPLFSALEFVGVYDFLPNPDTPSLFYYFCDVLKLVCEDIIYAVADLEVDEDNEERYPVIFAHEPGGTSMQNMKYWQQMIEYKTQKVQKYDYGKKGNQEKYGSDTPPLYDLSKVPGPIALFMGTGDRLSDQKDDEWLIQNIPKESIVYSEVIEGFGHLTFMWAKNMTYFDKVISLAKEYSEEFLISNE